ncbi:MAG: dihydropteroate synthase [Clostridium sp.]|jgi:dihydropteroate synthase|nr:dihydropteroate synthase [Clostridium sp.]
MCDGKVFDFASLPCPAVMGILNVTPDSFSDGGRYFGVDAALARALEMQAQGADIIDLGGQSTRPGAAYLDAEEEIGRIAPVLDALRGVVSVPISVDSFHSAVAEYALEHGASIVNDVSGMAAEEMCRIVRLHGAGWIIMHNPGGQGGAAAGAEYPNGVVAAVREFFSSVLTRLSPAVPEGSLIFDPGFGFCKNFEEQMELLRSLDELGQGLLVGLSRKRFVRELFGAQGESELDIASAALHALAAKNGAKIIRTHNVVLTRKVLALL